MDNMNNTDNQFVSEENAAPAETATSKKIKAVVTSRPFFVSTVAFTALAALSLITSGLDLFATLFAIGMWLAVTAAKSATPTKEIKFLSGTVKAYYIVNIVAIVGLVIGGIAFILAAPAAMEAKDLLYEALGEFKEEFPLFAEEYTKLIYDLEIWTGENLGMALSVFIGLAMIVMGIVFIVSAVITFIINTFFVKKLSRRLKECTMALEEGRESREDLFALKNWFTVIGIIHAVLGGITFVSGDITSALISAAAATAYIALSYAFKVEPCEEKAEEIKTKAEL